MPKSAIILFIILTSTTQKTFGENTTILQKKIDLECGGVFTTKQIVIESPNYPSNYPNNLDCYYLLQGPECPFYYTFKFLDFNLENSLGCAKDRLSIDNQDALCNTTSGSRDYWPRDGVLQLRFITNENVSNRGFRILITRSQCDYTTTITPVTQRTNTVLKSAFPSCCENGYSAKRLFITSPGFPYTNSQQSDCVYNIYRTNNNICRLRIHFLFFWSGLYGQKSCENGYLLIDGKYVCGCRIGLKLTSPFDMRWGNSPKTLRFKNLGLPKSVFSGFALEIIQDECPNKYLPENNDVYLSEDKERNIGYYNDQINKIAWPNITTIERAKEISDSTELLDSASGENTASGSSKEQIVKHFYFFKEQEDDVGSAEAVLHKEPEEMTYVDTFSTSFLPNGHDNLACRSWGILQWTLLAKQMLWNNMPKCGGTAPDLSLKCKELNFYQGYFQSPGYPYYYPGNTRLCYRFMKKPGYCFINFHVLDFQLEESYECTGSHLLLGGVYRYCGNSLFNRQFTVDISNKAYEEVIFNTKTAYCARGFRAVYELVPCTQNPQVTPTPKPGNCNQKIEDEAFTIQFNNKQETCIFNIIALENACELHLLLVSFNLMCGSEYMMIKGQKYCGNLTGRAVRIVFDESDKVEITIRTNVYSAGQLHIEGRQKMCEDLEVPAQRTVLLKTNATDSLSKLSGSNYTGKPGNASEVSQGEAHKSICGLVMNVSDTEQVCERLKARPEIEDCFRVSPHIIYVPYETKNFTTLLPEVYKSAEVLTYKEVTCKESETLTSNATKVEKSDN